MRIRTTARIRKGDLRKHVQVANFTGGEQEEREREREREREKSKQKDEESERKEKRKIRREKTIIRFF